MRIFLWAFIWSAVSLEVFTVEWSLQVTDPEYGLTHYDLKKEAFRPYLKKTSWRCFVGPSEEKNALTLKSLRCNYSIEKTGEFTTAVSCGLKRPYDESLIDLYDERKDLLFSLKFSCRLNPREALGQKEVDKDRPVGLQ